jgi:RNA polymerase sigma factor (sigma-70 family)
MRRSGRVFEAMSGVQTAARPAGAASDVQLVRATRAEDDDAFEELYRRYHAPVAGYVRRIVRDGGRAEEVAQETFMAALRRIRQTESEIQFKPWIYRIARNAAIDHRRRSGRMEETSLDNDRGFPELETSDAPEATLIDKERFNHLCAALHELSEPQRQIIVLRELEGFSYREIADRMQLSPAAVESALFRARRKLQHEYEQLDTGLRCAHIRRMMARLAEGIDSERDRSRLARHARRCWSCRRAARQIGLEPFGAARRVMALLPLPAFLRRVLPGGGPGTTGVSDAPGIAGTPALEGMVQGVHKAAVVVISAIAIGGGGATLGGAGPLASHAGHTSVKAAGHGSDRAVAPAGRVKTGPAARRSVPRRSSGAGRSRDRRRGTRPPSATHDPSVLSPSPGPHTQAIAPARDPGVAVPGVGGNAPVLPRVEGPALPPRPTLPQVPEVPPVPSVQVDTGAVTGQVDGVLPEGSVNPVQLVDGSPPR